jgi:hypothetical protein
LRMGHREDTTKVPRPVVFATRKKCFKFVG